MTELSGGTSTFFAQFQQQLHRRLFPAAPVPQTAEEIAASPASVLVYLERFGGYKGQKTLGMTMWLLGHCMDAAARGDMRLCLEHLALTMASLEQVGVDQGDWSLGFLQSLVAEPPLTVFQERQQVIDAKLSDTMSCSGMPATNRLKSLFLLKRTGVGRSPARSTTQ